MFNQQERRLKKSNYTKYNWIKMFYLISFMNDFINNERISHSKIGF
jgi:hypothetical protein